MNLDLSVLPDDGESLTARRVERVIQLLSTDVLTGPLTGGAANAGQWRRYNPDAVDADEVWKLAVFCPDEDLAFASKTNHSEPCRLILAVMRHEPQQAKPDIAALNNDLMAVTAVLRRTLYDRYKRDPSPGCLWHNLTFGEPATQYQRKADNYLRSVTQFTLSTQIKDQRN